MPILKRLRLGSVGCAEARFDPLELELVGADGRLRHTALFLENGGGKSSLIALVLLLLNPKVTRLGKNEKGEPRLESEYVLPEETGVVLAEWIPDERTADRPRTIVTLMALERFPSADADGGARGTARKGFVRLTLPPGEDAAEALGLRQLLPREARRREGKGAPGLEAILKRAREQKHAHPDWDVAAIPGNEPGRWLRELQSVGLSPEIGRLLARMNLEEGGVAEALTFSSSREFVAHAARLLAPPDEIVEPFHGQLRSFATSFRAQASQVHTREEIERVRPVWSALVDRGREYHEGLGAFKDAARDLRALEVGVAGALAGVETGRASADAALVEAEQRLRDAEESVHRAAGEERALAHVVAKGELEAAEAALDGAKKAADVAVADHRRSQALVPAVRLRAAEERAKALRAAIEAQSQDRAADIERRDALALALAALAEARAKVLAEGIATDAARELSLAAACTLRAKELRDLSTRLGGLEADERSERRALGLADEALRALRAGGDVGASEPPVAAAARHRGEEARLCGERQALEEERRTAASARSLAEERARAATRALEGLAGERRGAEDRLVAHRRACDEVLDRLRKAEIAGVEPSHTVARDGDRLRELATAAEREATLEVAAASARRASLAETVRHLESRDALPPSLGQRRVLERAEGSAEPALPYLRAAFGAAAERMIAAEPGFVHAVVVTKADDADRIVQGAADLELRLDVPVPVYAAADLRAAGPREPASGRPGARAVLGLGPHVRDDLRERVLELRRTEHAEETRREVQLTARQAELTRLRGALEAVVAAHGARAQEDAAAELRRIDAAIRAADEALGAAKGDASRQAQLVSELEPRIATALEDERCCAARARRVEAWIERHAEAHGGAPARLVQLGAAIAAAKASRDRLESQEQLDRVAIDEARERRRSAEEEATTVRAEVARYSGSVSRAATRPARLSTEEVPAARAEWEALDGSLRGGEATLRARLEAAHEDAKQHRRDLERIAKADAAAILRDLAPSLDESKARDAEESAGRTRDERKADHVKRGSEREHARETARSEEGALLRLAPRPAAAARALATSIAGLDLETLRARLAEAPARRAAVEHERTESTAAQKASEEAARSARGLERSWRELIAEAGLAWQSLRIEDFGRDAAAIEGIVRADANCQEIMNPAGQLESLRRALREVRGVIQTRRHALAGAQQRRLQAAQDAVAASAGSTSEFVRRAAEIQTPPGLEGHERDHARLVGLAERAETDLRLLDDQLASLAAKLAALVKDQEMIAVGLSDEVSKLHERLRDLERLSVLPHGLDAWSGKQFLKLEVPLVDHATRVDTLRRWIADLATRDAIPSPRELFPAALEASMLGEPHASIPKAHRFDEFRRRPIQQLSKDSGGEGLTGAFILFCLLARVVTNRERRAGARRTSLALLDNPTGKASKFDFVEAQCRIAAAFGVQYIAATGVGDLAALERFERLITLRNPAQQRVLLERVDDQGEGRALEAVLLARSEVLSAPEPTLLASPAGAEGAS